MKGLPSFPAESDMWTALRQTSRPIVIYGMGNGADKLIKRFDSLGIKYADVFASDGFVRGHSFHGVRVKSFSEIKELYSDFIIVLSFASRLPDVIRTMIKIDGEYELYVPDMPVSEEEVYFDKDFYNTHYEEIRTALDALADEESKNVYSSVIRYKLSGRIGDLLEFTSTKEEMYSLLPLEKIESFCDVGAYTGDTFAEALSFFPNLRSAVLIEPDKKTFKRLCRFVAGCDSVSVECINAAAWYKTGDGAFFGSGNRNSSVADASTHSFEFSVSDVPLVRVDERLSHGADYIKYDVEGSEREALLGSAGVIKKYKPAMLVSLYHKSRDIFELVNLMKRDYPEYRLYLRRLYCLPAWEINLIMLPRY